MSDVAIKVEGLSKRYRIGQYVGGGAYQYRVLRDVLTDAMHAPFRRLRARSKQRAIGSNPTADSHESSANFIWALKDVSLEVKRGEVVGVIGRNGAGKSTFLKVLSRITEPTKGRAEIKGRVGSLLEVGTGFHPELTGRENVYLSGAILGMAKKEIDRKFDEMVDFSEVEKFIDTPVKRYSSGMLVRLGFAVAAHLETEILLVDEVLAVGDVTFQRKCLGKMGDVAKKGRTVLFVSHNMSAISRLCSEAIWMDNGIIRDFGKSTSITNKYLSGQTSSNYYAKLGADHDKPMRLRETGVIKTAGDPASRFEMNESIGVRVTYDVNQAVSGAHIICFLDYEDGVRSLGTGDADTLPERLGTRLPGKYESIFWLPPYLLGEGYYSITISLAVPFVLVYDRHEQIISFHIDDTKSNRRKWQHKKRPGILGVELDWKAIKLQ